MLCTHSIFFEILGNLSFSVQRLSTNNGTIKGEACNYKIKPEKQGRATIFINKMAGKDTILIGQKEFRVKQVPMPIATVGGKKLGTVAKNWLLAQTGIKAVLENFYYDVRFNVSNYTIMIIRDQDIIFEQKVEGYKFTKEFKTALRNSRSGDIVLIEKVYTVWPEGEKGEMKSVGNFKIK